MPYELEPRYPIVGGKLDFGFDALAAEAARARGLLSIDGPAALDWTHPCSGLMAWSLTSL